MEIDHFYVFGDVYETLDTCQELEQLLGRLRRKDILTEQDWVRSKHYVAAIRNRLESTLPVAS